MDDDEEDGNHLCYQQCDEHVNSGLEFSSKDDYEQDAAKHVSQSQNGNGAISPAAGRSVCSLKLLKESVSHGLLDEKV